jgi:hypothetical protein
MKKLIVVVLALAALIVFARLAWAEYEDAIPSYPNVTQAPDGTYVSGSGYHQTPSGDYVSR